MVVCVSQQLPVAVAVQDVSTAKASDLVAVVVVHQADGARPIVAIELSHRFHRAWRRVPLGRSGSTIGSLHGTLSLVVIPLLRLRGALAYDGLLEVVKLHHVRALSDVEV